VTVPGDSRHGDEAVLDLKGVSRSYPGVQALADVSFSVAPRSIHALLGENGAGKSTLIRILSGAERPERGTMTLAGAHYAPASPLAALRSGVSTLYQEQSLFPDRDVASNILVGAEPSRWGVVLDRRGMHRSARELLDHLGAGHLATTMVVGSLNVADRQMVDIARALHRRSRLLIMDEPTAALTSREVDALFEVISGLPSLGVSVLFVSHRMEEIFRISQAVTVLRDGRHIRTAPATELTPDDLVRAMIGRSPDSMFPPRPAARPREPVLDTHRLSGRTYSEVSLTLHEGEILALAGVTGSGKEELGMALYGAVPPRSGTILLGGRPQRLTPRRAMRLGVVGVPADRKGEAVIGPLSVRRNLGLPSLGALSTLSVLIRRREQKLAQRQAVDLAIKASSLSVPVNQLSGGNQQKVALGKWLQLRPSVLVLLEPTQGIDVGVRFEFYRLLRGLAGTGTGVILVSSDIPEVLGLADRIVVLRGGRVVGELAGADASPEQLLRLSLGQVPAWIEPADLAAAGQEIRPGTLAAPPPGDTHV